MKLIVPSKEEVVKLLVASGIFRDFSVCAEALPPVVMLEQALASEEGLWLTPRLFCVEHAFQIVGSGGFKSGPRDGRVEIGYGIAPMCRRRGYGTEGVRLLVEEAFASERIDEVFAEVAVWNEASQSLLRKLGFRVLEGIIGDEGPMDIWGLQKRPDKALEPTCTPVTPSVPAAHLRREVTSHAMEKTPARRIWEFFVEYYDDDVVMPSGGPVVVSARTMRVVGALFGRLLLRQIVEAWTREGVVRVLGDWEELIGDAPCIEVLDYVSEQHIDSPMA